MQRRRVAQQKRVLQGRKGLFFGRCIRLAFCTIAKNAFHAGAAGLWVHDTCEIDTVKISGQKFPGSDLFFPKFYGFLGVIPSLFAKTVIRYMSFVFFKALLKVFYKLQISVCFMFF